MWLDAPPSVFPVPTDLTNSLQFLDAKADFVSKIAHGLRISNFGLWTNATATP